MAYSGPTVVQAVSVDYSGLAGHTATQSPAFASTHTAGNSILVSIRYFGIDTSAGMVITDLAPAGGNIYTLVFSAGNSAGSKCCVSIWRADNIAATASNKITVTSPTGASFGGFDACETTPLGTVDQTGSLTNAVGGSFGPTVTTTHNNELCVGGFADDGGFSWTVGTNIAWVHVGTGVNEGISESFGLETAGSIQAKAQSGGLPKQVGIIATFPVFVPVGPISADITGTTAVVAALAGTGAVAATILGTTIVTASMAGSGALAAALFGTTTVSGTLLGSGSLAADIFGTTSVTANLIGFAAIAAAITGSTSVTASLKGSGALVCNILGVGSVVCTMDGTGQVVCHIVGTTQVSVSAGEPPVPGPRPLPYSRRTAAAVATFACIFAAQHAKALTSDASVIAGLQAKYAALVNLYRPLTRQDSANQEAVLSANIAIAATLISQLDALLNLVVPTPQTSYDLGNIHIVVENARMLVETAAVDPSDAE